MAMYEIPEKFDDVVHHVLRDGPDRVMISQDEAVSCRRAREQYGVSPTVIFIRKDGWALGAPRQFEWVAYCTWSEQWMGFLRRPETRMRPMSEYDLPPEEGGVDAV